jgi:hypothetical protein
MELTLLGFHSLKESLDLCVVRVIASNGNAHTACRRDGVRDFIDRSGRRVRGGGGRSPGRVDNCAPLSEKHGNALADASAGSSYDSDFTG